MTYIELRAWMQGFLAGHAGPWGPTEIKAIRGMLDEYERKAASPKQPPAPTPAAIQDKIRDASDWEMIRDKVRKEAERTRLPDFPRRTFSPGCSVCGLGSDGSPTGYVCQRGDCPTRITCGDLP